MTIQDLSLLLILGYMYIAITHVCEIMDKVLIQHRDTINKLERDIEMLKKSTTSLDQANERFNTKVDDLTKEFRKQMNSPATPY